jgi:hypothetical protein
MQHRIRTQVLEVVADKVLEAFSLQQSMSHYYYASILPVLEKAFDEWTAGDEILYLDKLEIDIGFLPAEELERNSLPVETKSRLLALLKEELTSRRTKSHIQIPYQHITAQWIYYMEHGFLPWNIQDTGPAWYAKVLESMAADHPCIELLRRLITGNPLALERIVLLHPENYLANLVEVLTAKKQSRLAEIITGLSKFIFTHASEEKKPELEIQFIRNAWKNILAFAATEKTVHSELSILHWLISNLALQQGLPGPPDKKYATALLKPFIPAIMEQFKKIKPAGEIKRTDESGVLKSKTTTRENIPEQGLFIKQAGLVLLHPFLPAFFKNIRLCEGRNFKDRARQQKAVGILHWLATGSTVFEEHELVICKILCGYPLGDLAEPVIPFLEDELEAGKELLEAVIGEWKVLKNSSVSALREAFLLRGAKLIHGTGPDKKIIMEKQAIDVLLDNLPWNLNMIRLPWMQHLLTVEWR